MGQLRRRIDYAEARPMIQDYDLILFSGRSPISRLIRLATGSSYSHVGVALWATEEHGESGILLLLESTPINGSIDHYTQTSRDGVQCVELSARIAGYNGDVFWRQITGPRTPEMRRELLQVRKELSGLQYEKNVLEFIGAAWHTIPNRDNREYLFCSEVAAFVERRGGLLLDPQPDNEMTPEDLSSEADRPIAWKPGYEPQPEMQLLMPRYL